METVRLCSFCHLPADLVCHRCRDPYCSRTCQQIDWPQHKTACFPMPTLVRPFNETPYSKSETDPTCNPSLRPPSPSTTFRSLKLSKNCDAKLKNDISHSSSLHASKENVPNNDVNDFIKSKCLAVDNIPLADRISIIEKPEEKTEEKPEGKNPVKPAYYKSDKIDAASIRKPGILSQVMPKQATVQPPKQMTVEPPKQVKAERKFEPPKQVTVEREIPKQVAVEQQKQVTVEREIREIPKQVAVEQPKHVMVEPPKEVTVDPLSIKSSPAELKASNSKLAEPQLQKNETGPWMKALTIEDNEFADVTVQFVAPDNTTWVSLTKHDEANNNLLRVINRNSSTTSAPNPAEIKINSLFLVPFEDIYYRGIVLQPVTPKGTVSVRLIDFGNEFELPIGQLKLPLLAMTDKNAYAFPIQFKNPRKVEIGNTVKIKKESMHNGIAIVIVEGEKVMLTVKDIDSVPISVGANIDLVCLDFSNVSMGYISASIPEKKAIQFVEEMGQKMTEYCAQSADGYSPRADELCFAKFEDDQWYRAVTLRVIDSDQFEIMFIDYGNIITVNSSAIRKMVDDFLFPCLTNLCKIKGFPKSPSKEDIQKMALYFNDHSSFRADTVEKDNQDAYVIHVTI